jgi:Na+-translocating ferredoxin:NAD+ oxidoreductase RnfG subunit
MNFLFKFISLIAIIFSSIEVAFAQEEYKCIWRNPERTMVRIFPEALDYKTITKEISSQQLKQIEEKAGKLLPGQREIFQYYELMASESSLGYIFTSTQKAEYGAIEFVFGVDKAGKIVSIYIQRSRERDREFKKKEFLDLFIGKSANELEAIEFTKTVGTEAILSGIRKELMAFEILK